MRAVLCKELRGADGLVVENVPAPVVGPGQVRLEVHACGINFADTLIIEGKYQARPELPFIPGMEASGVVVECGEGVTAPAPGTRVLAMTSIGGYAEEAVCDAKRVVPIPDSMSFADAAAFPVAYGTSHGALDHRARLQAGETLLVLGASGGVGLTAVEIGKQMGATVIATASSAEKLAVAKAAGADHLIDYTKESLRDRVLELTGGADVVYDPVGGDLLKESLRAINWEGRLIVIGFASGTIPQIPANYLLLKNCAAVGFFWGAYMERDPDVVMRSLDTMLGWYAEGRLKPHISHLLPMDKAREALWMLRDRRSTGKVVLDMGRG